VYIQKFLIGICFVLSLFSTNILFGMKRDAENAQTLLEKWYGKQDKVCKTIKDAKKTQKQQVLTLEDKTLQATFLPVQKKVVLYGQGFETIEHSFDYFVQQISPKEQISPRPVIVAKKERCAVQ
jgi:hypothetical protein